MVRTHMSMPMEVVPQEAVPLEVMPLEAWPGYGGMAR